MSDVSPTGGYNATVPISLPSPRGGLPLPFELRYTGTGKAGAAGIGWDVPLWYVRRSGGLDGSLWHRKPATYTYDLGRDVAPERLYLSMGGSAQRMVPGPEEGLWLPYVADEYMELREEGTGVDATFTLRTARGVDYVFRNAPSVPGAVDDPSLWLLTAVVDRVGTDFVLLDYENTLLRRISYTHSGPQGPALYEVSLDYEHWTVRDPEESEQLQGTLVEVGVPGMVAWVIGTIVSDGIEIPRSRVLKRVIVSARDNLDTSSSLRAIRTYHLTYAPDEDTTAPRLDSVDVSGDVSEDETLSDDTMPVARYAYGSISKRRLDPEKPDDTGDPFRINNVVFGAPVVVPRDAAAIAANATTLAGSRETTDGTDLVKDTVRSTHTIRDFTGDGVADLIYKQDDTWHLVKGTVTDAGVSLDGGPTTSWSTPPEIHVQRILYYKDPLEREARRRMTTTETLVTFTDFNSDGRVDILDARTHDPLSWRVYINREGPHGLPAWAAPFEISVADLVAHLELRGIEYDPYEFDTKWTPLERTRSWPKKDTTWEWSDYNLNNVPDPGESFDPRELHGPTDTVAEWVMSDVNGDGFLDIVANTQPVKECEVEEDLRCNYPDGYLCTWGRLEYVRMGACPEEGDAPVDDNQTVAFLLREGAFHGIAGRDYQPPVGETAETGVARWTQGDGDDGPYNSNMDAVPPWRSAGFMDVHGIGRPHHVRHQLDNDDEATGYEHFVSNQHECGWNSELEEVIARQIRGLVDLNGDGIPDFVYKQGSWGDGPWYVRFGTTAGFGPPRQIFSPDLGFALSESRGECGEPQTTIAGLLDLDGDGKPELVRVGDDGVLRASEITTSDGVVGGVHAGRLVAVDNGYGARTEIRYANNKAEEHTPHQLAAPEIVVAETQVTVEDGSASDSVTTRYAYGTVDRRFDPGADRVVFTGYRRMVTLVGGVTERSGSDLVEGVATIVDRRPPAPFGLHGASYQDFVLGGRIDRVHRLEGVFGPDPRELLWLAEPFPQVRGHQSFGYEVTELEVAGVPAEWIGAAECMDVDDSGLYTWGEWLCHHAGVVRPSTVFEWEGLEAPAQGQRNVARATAVLEVDERGRPIEIVEYGDMRTYADDRCIAIQYEATPDPWSAIRGIWTTDCGWTNATWSGLGGVGTPGTPVLLAGQRLLYDGRRLTQRIVENYDTSDGSFLGEHVAVTLAYDQLGNVERVVAEREMGTAATRTTSFEYDGFGASLHRTTESASDVAQTFTQTLESPTWPTEPIVATDHNGVTTTTDRDHFGRPVRTRVSAAGFEHLTGEVEYSPGGDEVTGTTYPAGAGAPQRTHVHLDALGRVRFRQTELGADYGSSTLVSDLVEYDGFGRPVWAAAPFEWAELPFSPDDLPADPGAWPFGVTTVYDSAGLWARTVEAHGKRTDPQTTDAASNIFVSRVDQTWDAGRSITRVRGPSETSAGEPSSGAWDDTIATALGWPIESARFSGSGARIDLVRRGFDRFGNEAAVSRYKQPASESQSVTWSRRYDSLGRLLHLAEPGNAPITNVYDEWGGLLESSWFAAGSVEKVTRFAYDGLGRQTLSEVVSIASGAETIESRERSYFDAHSGSPHQPSSDLRGRLSWIETEGVGAVYLGYDAVGRASSESHLLSAHGQLMRTSHTFAPGGALQELRFDTPVGTDQTDRIEYRYDSAMRTRAIVDAGTGVPLFRATSVDAETGYEEILLGNGVREVFGYAPAGRRELIHWGVTTVTGQRDQFPMVRDAEGRLRQESVNHFGSPYFVQHEYDALDRVVRSYASGPSQPQDEEFGYDPLGNLTRKRNVLQSNQNRDYVYQDGSDPDRLCRFGQPNSGSSCNSSYDAAGNLVDDTWGTWGGSGNRTFTYDAASRVRQIQRGTWRASFQYGPGGALTFTEVWSGSTLHRRIWSFGGLIEERRRPDGRTQIERRVPGPLGIVATLRTEDTTRETVYVHGDGRGNRFFTGSDGRIKQEVRYRAFGSVVQDSGAASDITYSDDLWNGGDELRELGVVILGARVFDPVVGRFLQRDPIALNHSSTQGNPYSFAFNDPVNLSDPTGLCPTAPNCDNEWSPGADSGFDELWDQFVGGWGTIDRAGHAAMFTLTFDPVGESGAEKFTEGLVQGAVGILGGLAGAAWNHVDCHLQGGGIRCTGEALEAIDGAVEGAVEGTVDYAGDILTEGPIDATSSRLRAMGGGSEVRGFGVFVGSAIIGGALFRWIMPKSGAAAAGGGAPIPTARVGASTGGGPRQLLPGLVDPEGQIGRKVAQHGPEWGLSPRSAVDRNTFWKLANRIVGGYDDVRQGPWHPKSGGGTDYLFYARKGRVVVTKPNGQFVTLLKDGLLNAWFANARKLN